MLVLCADREGEVAEHVTTEVQQRGDHIAHNPGKLHTTKRTLSLREYCKLLCKECTRKVLKSQNSRHLLVLVLYLRVQQMPVKYCTVQSKYCNAKAQLARAYYWVLPEVRVSSSSHSIEKHEILEVRDLVASPLLHIEYTRHIGFCSPPISSQCFM